MSMMEAVAVNVAHSMVDTYGGHLIGQEKAELWQQFFNVAYAAIMDYDVAASADRFRVSAKAMEN